MDRVLEWWQVGLAAATFVVGLFVARARQQWRLDHMEREIERMSDRVKHLEAQGVNVSIALAEISTSQKMILQAISELRTEISSKADK